MSPEEALQVLIQCASQAPLPNVGHDQWKMAYKILGDFITKNSKPEIPAILEDPNDQG